MTKLLYSDLTYKINGAIYDVHNQLGGSQPEKYYQKAVAVSLKQIGISYEEQKYVPLEFNGVHIGKHYLDFLIEDKIVLELKRGRYIAKNVYNQVSKYLETLNLPLGLVACFASDVAVIKRIVNHIHPLIKE